MGRCGSEKKAVVGGERISFEDRRPELRKAGQWGRILSLKAPGETASLIKGASRALIDLSIDQKTKRSKPTFQWSIYALLISMSILGILISMPYAISNFTHSTPYQISIESIEKPQPLQL